MRYGNLGGSSLRSLVLPVYVQAFLLAAANGAMSAFPPLYFIHLGTSVAGAAILVGVGTAGIILLDLPSGFIVARYGERRVLAVSGMGIVGASLLIAVSPTPLVATAVGVFLASGAASFWFLGRLEFMRKALMPSARGRGLAAVGGVMRAGQLLGPLAGGARGKRSGISPGVPGNCGAGRRFLLLFLVSPATRMATESPRVPGTAHLGRAGARSRGADALEGVIDGRALHARAGHGQVRESAAPSPVGAGDRVGMMPASGWR